MRTIHLPGQLPGICDQKTPSRIGAAGHAGDADEHARDMALAIIRAYVDALSRTAGLMRFEHVGGGGAREPIGAAGGASIAACQRIAIRV
jgi:hypothetical protein